MTKSNYGVKIKSYHYYDPVHAYFLVYGFNSGELKSRVKIDPSYEEFDNTLKKRVIEKIDVELSAISSIITGRLSIITIYLDQGAHRGRMLVQ